MPRAGFEPARTRKAVNYLSFLPNRAFIEDLESFKLFARSKLNLTQNTVYHYSSKIRTLYKSLDRGYRTVADRDIQLYIG